MRRHDLVFGLLVLAAGAALGQATQPAGQTAPPRQEMPAAVQNPVPTYTVPAGTKVLLALKSAINTKSAQPGDGVYLISTFPVVSGNHVVIPAGVYVQGVVDRVQRPGRVKGRAQLDMHFTTMIFPAGQVVELPGVVNSLPGSDGPTVKGSEGTVEQAGSKAHDVGDVLKGAAVGAEGGVIGGAATGDPLKGAGYGGMAGAAAGLVYTLFTRGKDINIPSGTSVEMVLQRPLILQAEQSAVAGEAAQTQIVPAAQQQPLKKPRTRVLCPPGGLGCD